MRKIPDIYIHPPHSNTIFMTILALDSFDYSCYQGFYENSDLGPKFLGNQKFWSKTVCDTGSDENETEK